MNTFQYKKSSCLYHPQSIITNFCKDKTCLMPLCPSCISQHTQYHQDKGNKPIYTTIFQAFSQMNSQAQSLVFSFQQDKKRNNQLIYRIHEVPAIIHQKIVSAKRMTMQIIDQAFSKLQKQVLAVITKTQQQQDIYSLKKCEIYQQNIINKLDQLYFMMASLKTDRALSNLIHFNKQKMNQCTTLHQKISHYLYNNQNYFPKIDINTDYARSLTNIIFKMVKPCQIKQKNNKKQRQKQKSRVKTNQNQERNQKQSTMRQQYKQNVGASSRKLSSNSLYKQGSNNTPLKSYNKSYNNQKQRQKQRPHSHFKNSNIVQAITYNQNSNYKNNYNNPDNSPYRNKLVKVQPYSDVYQNQNTQMYKNQYTNIQQKVSDIKRQNEVLEKSLKYN